MSNYLDFGVIFIKYFQINSFKFESKWLKVTEVSISPFRESEKQKCPVRELKVKLKLCCPLTGGDGCIWKKKKKSTKKLKFFRPIRDLEIKNCREGIKLVLVRTGLVYWVLKSSVIKKSSTVKPKNRYKLSKSYKFSNFQKKIFWNFFSQIY